MKCLLCKTNDLDCHDPELDIRKFFCQSCYWNEDNSYEFLEEIVTKQKDKEMTTELKFPEAEDYPDGFNWFAYDANGEGWFYETKPYIEGVYWLEKNLANKQSSIFESIESVQNWRETLREKPTTQTNTINPEYYKWHPVTECINIIQEFPFSLGTAIKYLWRVASPDARKYDSKEDRITDLKKAIRCIEFEIERIKAE